MFWSAKLKDLYFYLASNGIQISKKTLIAFEETEKQSSANKSSINSLVGSLKPYFLW